jgi:hypothetical protein
MAEATHKATLASRAQAKYDALNIWEEPLIEGGKGNSQLPGYAFFLRWFNVTPQEDATPRASKR